MTPDELEDRDLYIMNSAFYVPEKARWSFLKDHAKTPEIGLFIDAAMDAIEADNKQQLQGVLPKVYAKENLDKNFIGIDLKGARLWAGAKESLILELTNVAFIRAQIELVSDLFSENEIDEIWITFPDPQIKHKRTKHRLTNPQFLAKYKNILKPEGFIHLKTDSEYMHGYTLGLLQGMGIEVEYAHHDLYTNPYAPKEASAVQTYYEKIYLEENKPITYLKFKFP